VSSAAQRGRAFLRRHSGRNAPSVTYVLIAVNLLVFLVQIIPGSNATNALLYAPAYSLNTGAPFEPWRMLTSAFAHSPSSLLHIGLNMLSLFFIGPLVENLVGRGRFLALYLFSAFGGSLLLLLTTLVGWSSQGSAVVGASGAIFGLLAALFVIQRSLGANPMGLLVLLGLNLVITFLPGSSISWQAHVGGLIVGAIVGFIYTRTRNIRQKPRQIGLMVGLGAVLVVLSLLPRLL
jgi:membrane associated rhomboid family serine protease